MALGFFSYLFGTGGTTLSRVQRPLSTQEIETLVSRTQIQTLDRSEEKIVEKAIEDRRLGDGKISLFQIDEALAKLERAKKISKFDRKSVLKNFEQYFEHKFKK